VRYNIYHSLPNYVIADKLREAQIEGNHKIVKLAAQVLLYRYRKQRYT
jgi:hypothetical protein